MASAVRSSYSSSYSISILRQEGQGNVAKNEETYDTTNWHQYDRHVAGRRAIVSGADKKKKKMLKTSSPKIEQPQPPTKTACHVCSDPYQTLSPPQQTHHVVAVQVLDHQPFFVELDGAFLEALRELLLALLLVSFAHLK